MREKYQFMVHFKQEGYRPKASVVFYKNKYKVSIFKSAACIAHVHMYEMIKNTRPKVKKGLGG